MDASFGKTADVDGREFNRHFAKSNSHFNKCCEMAGVKPTKRQASKFRSGFGKAYKFAEEVKS